MQIQTVKNIIWNKIKKRRNIKIKNFVEKDTVKYTNKEFRLHLPSSTDGIRHSLSVRGDDITLFIWNFDTCDIYKPSWASVCVNRFTVEERRTFQNCKELLGMNEKKIS